MARSRKERQWHGSPWKHGARAGNLSRWEMRSRGGHAIKVGNGAVAFGEVTSSMAGLVVQDRWQFDLGRVKATLICREFRRVNRAVADEGSLKECEGPQGPFRKGMIDPDSGTGLGPCFADSQ